MLFRSPITKGTLDKLLNEEVDAWQDEIAKTGYSRNKTLIDLTCIPLEVKEKIINTYDEIKPATKQKMLNYFMEHKLKNLMDVIEEF